MSPKQKLEEAIAFVKAQDIPNTAFGIILGTGFSQISEAIQLEKKISYEDIPHFPKPTVLSHEGYLLYGKLFGVPCMVFQGRLHRYEGYSYFEITLLIRLFNGMGGKTIMLCNAAGGLDLRFKKGELMLLKDHINLQGGSPLAENGIAELGPRFVDMRLPYEPTLIHQISSVAKQLNITLHQGVYAAVIGPQLETAAEYRYLKTIGADAVGMSTVPEVIVARQLALRVVAVAVITDICNPDDLAPIDIPDILAAVSKGENQWLKLLEKLLPNFYVEK